MATGVPGKNPNNHYHPVRLEYEGKRSVTAILNTPANSFLEIHHHASRNRLYYGENFDALLSLIADSTVCGKVTLIYIDPPSPLRVHFCPEPNRKHTRIPWRVGNILSSLENA